MSSLFTPSSIGSLTVPNRMVRSATAERMALAGGTATPALAEMYRDLARGGVGLIISGHLYVHASGKAHVEMTGIHEDAMKSSLAKVTEAVHADGGLVAAQINHGGMQCAAEVVDDPVAPSAIDEEFIQRPARELSADEIDQLIGAFAAAARRAKEAGFDAIQVHAAHGYLISQFLSPFINRRDDEWGGDATRRRRFLKEVCLAIRAEIGADFPLFIKLGVVDGMEGGLSIEESVETASLLKEFGLDAIEISAGLHNFILQEC